MANADDNLWILFEERPKAEIIRKILQIYTEDNNCILDAKNLKIKPIFNDNIFQFSYKLENCKISNIENIYLILVSAQVCRFLTF